VISGQKRSRASDVGSLSTTHYSLPTLLFLIISRNELSIVLIVVAKAREIGVLRDGIILGEFVVFFFEVVVEVVVKIFVVERGELFIVAQVE
jgi:hypothetical protein